MIANPNDGNTPKVEQAVPKISVSAAGLITATAEQQKGYVPGGTKSTTHQLTTQGAKTVTPGRTAQSAVASGYYTTGEVQVAGDSNLVAENIAEGVSIFGVVGTHSGGGKAELVNISFDSFRKSGELIYINGDGSYYIASNAGGAVNLSVLKNSIVYLNGTSYSSSGAVEQFSGTNAYFVSGDCTLTTY